MRFTIGSGNDRKTFDRPLDRDACREMANQIKGKFFAGASYRFAKARGVAALALV